MIIINKMFIRLDTTQLVSFKKRKFIIIIIIIFIKLINKLVIKTKIIN